MKAFVKYGQNPYEAEVREAPKPSPGAGEALLQVAGCGICGSDLHAWRGDAGYEWVRPPVVLGHEFAGTVIETGPGVATVSPGNNAVVIALQGCGECPICRAGMTNLCPDRKGIGLHFDGGMAPYAVVNAAYLLPLPGGLDPRLAPLAEPISVSINAVRPLPRRPGLRVVVTGPGPIGLFAAFYLKQSGCDVLLTGTAADAAVRLPAARRLGLTAADTDEIPLPQAITEAFSGGKPDAWVEAAGSVKALEAALNHTKPGGDVSVVGIYGDTLPWSPTGAVRAGLTVHFRYASDYAAYREAAYFFHRHVEILGPLADLRPLSAAETAFADAEKRKQVKIILTP